MESVIAAPDKVITVVESDIDISGFCLAVMRFWVRSATAVASWCTEASGSRSIGATGETGGGVRAAAAGGGGSSGGPDTEGLAEDKEFILDLDL